MTWASEELRPARPVYLSTPSCVIFRSRAITINISSFDTQISRTSWRHSFWLTIELENLRQLFWMITCLLGLFLRSKHSYQYLLSGIYAWKWRCSLILYGFKWVYLSIHTKVMRMLLCIKTVNLFDIFEWANNLIFRWFFFLQN